MNRRSFLPLLSLLAVPFVGSRAHAQVEATINGPRIYKARLTQTGEDAPTAEVFANSLGCDVEWVYHDTGQYIGRFTSQFPESAKVFCGAPVRDNSGDITTGSAVDFTMDGHYGGVMVCGYGEGENGLGGRREIEGTLFVSFEVYEP